MTIREIIEAFDLGRFTRDEALTRLVNRGYDSDEAEQMLDEIELASGGASK